MTARSSAYALVNFILKSLLLFSKRRWEEKTMSRSKRYFSWLTLYAPACQWNFILTQCYVPTWIMKILMPGMVNVNAGRNVPHSCLYGQHKHQVIYHGLVHDHWVSRVHCVSMLRPGRYRRVSGLMKFPYGFNKLLKVRRQNVENQWTSWNDIIDAFLPGFAPLHCSTYSSEAESNKKQRKS